MDAKELVLEQILILRCQTSDPGALSELIRRYEKPLRYFISRLLSEPASADDIFQDTWLAVLRRLSTLRKPEAFAAWLYRIARNKVYRQLRRKKKLIEIDESLGVPEGADEPTFSAADAADIHKSLSALKPQHKEVLMLRFLEQMSYQQLAQVLGCNVGTVRSRLHYAKTALKHELEK